MSFTTIEDAPQLDAVDKLILLLDSIPPADKSDSKSLADYRKKLFSAEKKLKEKIGETSEVKVQDEKAKEYISTYLHSVFDGKEKPRVSLHIDEIRRNTKVKGIISNLLSELEHKFRKDSALLKSIFKHIKKSSTLDELRAAVSVYESAIEVQDEVEYLSEMNTWLADEVDNLTKYKEENLNYKKELENLYSISFSEDADIALFDKVNVLRTEGYKEVEIERALNITRKKIRILDKKFS